jgi:uncharacterized protein YcbK (DUF882 family)
LTEAETPNEPQKVEEPKSKISTFLSHPAAVIIVFISAITSLIALPLSFYFYYAAKEYPRLTYYVNPAKAVVVKAGQASRLTTSYDNKVIDTDITAAQVLLWNNGSKSIKRENILKPIVIYTENNIPILEATIRRSSREVTQLALSTDETQQGRVTVLWNILEQNDGGIIQLIYAGDTNVQIRVDGVVEGQPHNEKYDPDKWTHKSWGGVALGVTIFFLLIAWLSRTAKASYRDANSQYLEALDSLTETYSNSLEYRTDHVKMLDTFIADYEERVKEVKDEEVKKLYFDTIAKYKEQQQEYREMIEEYESKIKAYKVRKNEVLLQGKGVARIYDIAAGGALVIASLAIIPTIYLLFIAQPIAPPFGF